MKKRKRKKSKFSLFEFALDIIGAVVIGHSRSKKKQNRTSSAGRAVGYSARRSTATRTFHRADELGMNIDAYASPRDNRYAWRLNCEDGSEYGIDPNDYETRTAYHSALEEAKYGWQIECDESYAQDIIPDDYETEEEYEDALSEAMEDAEERGADVGEWE